MEDISKTLSNFLGKSSNKISSDGKEEEVCDLQTGECYTIISRDGLVERINKTYVTEDGRQLLKD